MNEKGQPKKARMFIKDLEAKLQSMIEGRLASFLEGGLSPHIIAQHVARALEDQLIDEAGTLVAPDVYIVVLNGHMLDSLLMREENLGQELSQQIMALVYEERLIIKHHPKVILVSDDTLSSHEIRVRAEHSQQTREATQTMNPITATPANIAPPEAHLILEGGDHMPLERPVINIGRHRDNHIVINRQTVSRQHCQLKLRFGRYILYDLQSKSGTSVNGQKIQEHRLKSGDVMNIGGAQVVYIEYNENAEAGRFGSGDTQIDLDEISD